MRSAASGEVEMRANPATGKVGFARAEGRSPDLLPGVAADGRRGAVDKASAYLDRFSPQFGARAGELEQTEVYADKAGWSVTFSQSYKGVPVFGAELKAHVDRQGDLTSVNGFAAPGLSLDVTPGLTKAEASQKALATVKARPAGYKDGLPAAYQKGLKVREAELTIYRTGSPRGIDGEATLAWAVEVWNKATVRETLILDAATGKPLNRWSMMAHALERHVYEAQQEAPFGYDHVWSEGEDYPAEGMTEDQQNEALGASESYWMFRNTFGYNSWDGNSGPMYTINNDPRISCPNANWNGFSTNYCTGVTGDDTVAHEWGHAYTESTSGLIYQWQAGAMNEAYSDIWGETVDMLNARHNEGGETPADTTYRTPDTCSMHQASPYDLVVEITAPAEIAGPCSAAAGFGPELPAEQVNAEVVVATDASDAAGPTTTDGCSAFENAAEINGKWAYVDRGTCAFQVKADNAVAAGAEGLIIGNNVAGGPQGMSGDTSIYTLAVAMEDGTRIKSAEGPVEMSILKDTANYTDDSYRWLSGESDPAFGGAIRDMWSPTCYGDPGKVSDAEYHCTPDDAGGVHSNSGVVNRTFAILVDGMDGQGTGIGLDKAAWLFWHTQTNYLTPTSYFPDLADGLEASCAALTGVTFEKVTLGNPTEPDGSDGGVAKPDVVQGGMTAEDCAQVTDAIAETELRMDPTEQCAWEPLLQPGAPEIDCGDDTTTAVSFEEDFEDGLAGWTQDEEIGFEGGSGIPWEASTNASGDRPGGVAFGPDPVAGSCSGGEGDITSRNGLISPDITVPSGLTPRFSFDHYVATEATWDGGNVKVSVNGGEFEIVPVDAYLFNAPGGEMAPGSGPMELEPAWTGTDGGQLSGSWGTSVIDLAKVAGAGDTVKFRFDMGRDGCNGVDGWYVDNVTVESCEEEATKPSASTTQARVKPAKPRFRQDFRVITRVKAKDGSTATGTVVVKIDGKKVGKVSLKKGKAVVKVRKNLRPGKHKLVAKYHGSQTVKRSKDMLRFRITRR